MAIKWVSLSFEKKVMDLTIRYEDYIEIGWGKWFFGGTVEESNSCCSLVGFNHCRHFSMKVSDKACNFLLLFIHRSSMCLKRPNLL